MIGSGSAPQLEGVECAGLLSPCRSQLTTMQSNRLTKIAGLEMLVNLRELYISHNGIEKMEGLDALVSSACLHSISPAVPGKPSDT